MTVYLVKRLAATNITNGKSYNTETVKIENAVSVSVVTEDAIKKFSISDGTSTYKYAITDYILSVTN